MKHIPKNDSMINIDKEPNKIDVNEKNEAIPSAPSIKIPLIIVAILTLVLLALALILGLTLKKNFYF